MGPSSHCHRKSYAALPSTSRPLLTLLTFRLAPLTPDSPSDFASLRTLKTAQGPAILTRYLFHFAFRFRFSASRFSSSSALLFACLRSSPRPISISKLPCYHAFTADLSTLSSARGLTSLRYGSLFLEVGFTLRCLQRLSAPYFASLLCRWHDNSCTSGTFTPVLSY